MIRRVKLKDVCREITVGHVGPMAEEYVESGIPFLRSQNISPYRLDYANLKFINEDFHKRLKKSALTPGDVVVVRTGYPGTACVVPERLPVANCADLVILRPSAAIDGYFLCCLFNSIWGQGKVAGSLVGVAQQHFNIGVAKEMEISLPPLSIQKQITHILSAYDDLIENNTRRIKILEEMAQMIYREWFVNFRFPGHEKVRMLNSDIGRIPHGWRNVNIGEIATIHRGRSYKGTELVDDGGLPFLNLKCLERNGGFRYDGIKRFDGPYKDTQTALAGDVIVAVTDMTQERRLVARAARVPRTKEPLSVFSMDLVKVTPRPGATFPKECLYAILRFSNFGDKVKEHANGVNVLHLNPDRIAEFSFSIAPDGILRTFSKLAAAMFEMIDALHLKNSNLRQTRDLLLLKLISGEIDVKHSEAEEVAAQSV